jgi:hypothetical protein
MTNIRKYVYAGLLAIGSLNFAPGMASAQVQGKFTLPHDVHWQKALVPAGDYKFSLESDGNSRMLMLSKISGGRTGFLLMVQDSDDTIATGSGPGQLVLETTAEGSYVSVMQLPEFGMTLHFATPARSTEKSIARAGTAASSSAQ